jgi:hypothetical protein
LGRKIKAGFGRKMKAGFRRKREKKRLYEKKAIWVLTILKYRDFTDKVRRGNDWVMTGL